MKFISKILGEERPIISIETGDCYNNKSHFIEENIILKNEGIEDVSIRNLITEGILILDINMFFSKPQTIKNEIIGESIVMSFICSNNLEASIDKVKSEKVLIENTHNILYASKLKATITIPALEKINYLSIVLSPDFYSKLINEDWEVHKKFSENISQKTSGYLAPKYIPFNAGIQWVIHEIKNCTYEGALRKMYLEAKIKELLIFQFDSLMQKPESNEQIGEEDFNKLLEAKLILEKNFVNAPTLPELSRIISLNEFKLKKGFKACFETTVKSYIIKLRMEYAKKLVKNQILNVGEIAEKCGYKDVSHFSSAFKLFYGFTPASFRKNNLGVKCVLFYWEILDAVSFELLLI